MRRATIAGIALCLSPLGYAAGCAQQEEGTEPPDVTARGGSSTDGGSGGNGGSATSKGGSAGTASTGKGGSPSAGSGGSAGSTASAGTAGGTSTEGGAGGVPQGTGGDDGTCTDHAECDDDNPCTDDACNLGTCQNSANEDDCPDDGDLCTNDVCDDKACTHPDTGLCECDVDDDCDDNNECTDDSCAHDKTCLNEANTDPCATDDNECTDDVCEDKACKHNANTGSCTDDGTDCTDDMCSGGSCQHTNNLTCECVVPGDCDALENDPDNCTFNRCSAGGTCDFVDNDSCDAGTEFVVNNFNSAADWGTTGTGVTTPGGRPLTFTGFTNTNLEGNANVYLADTDGASITMDVASMAGLDRLAIIIQSQSTGTASMVKVGVFDGTWHDITISSLGVTISQNQYGTIEIPLLDYDIPLAGITQMRLVFSPTGGEKIWRIDHIEVRN
jgi:hypothetical protein